MTVGWVHPIMGIILSSDGEVHALFDYPQETTFRPIDPRTPEKFPSLRGVTFGPYVAALRAASASSYR